MRLGENYDQAIAWRARNQTHSHFPPPQEEPDAVLLVRDRTVRLTGDAENYVVNGGDQTVIICFKEEGAGTVTIKLDKLPALIAELSAINRKCSSMTVTPEMW